MPDCDLDGRIFLFAPHTHNRFFILHTFHFWKWVFENAVTSIADVHHIVMTIPWRLVTSFPSVTSNLTIQPVYIKHVKILDFCLSHGTDKGKWDKICQHRCYLRKSLSGMQENLYIRTVWSGISLFVYRIIMCSYHSYQIVQLCCLIWIFYY